MNTLSSNQRQCLEYLDSVIYSLKESHIGFSFFHFFGLTMDELKIVKKGQLDNVYLKSIYEKEKQILFLLEEEFKKETPHLLLKIIYEQFVIDLEKSILEFEINPINNSSKMNNNKI
jgi:hypothetical protein